MVQWVDRFQYLCRIGLGGIVVTLLSVGDGAL